MVAPSPSIQLVEEGSNVRLVEEGDRNAGEHNDASSTREEVQSNPDLYAPPAYTVMTTSGEESLDAEAFTPEKTPLLERSQSANRNDRPSPSYTPEGSASGSRVERPSSQGSSQVISARKLVEWTNDNANAIRCSVLNDRPATWTVKKKRGMALCPLAAAVLLREGILSTKHLQLVPSLLDRPSSSPRCDPHDPTDPLSAVIISSYDVIGDVLLGAVGGPIEVGQKLGPQGREMERNAALARLAQGSTWSRENPTENALMVGPKAIVHYGVGTYKGCRKIVETCIKTPMIYTHSLTRGFHNTPKLYGENLRTREEVFDLKSGLVVGGKTLVLGTYDGIKDFFWMPVKGAREEGVVGAGKGFCKGIGNMMCNFGEAACGTIGYSSYGIYKEIQNSASGGNLPARNVVLTLGEAEYEQANEEERRNVIKRWLQVQMRQM
ncbi:hypothetical protein DPSP01_012660 [Paraphaeosphaeria sporulosa]